MGESFSLEKFLDFSPTAWYKVFGLALKVFVFCLLILGVVWIKNFLFPTAPQNVNQPHITVADGGAVSYTVHQGKKERSWWIPTPFVEIFGELKTDEDNPALGARTGCRWEF